MRKCVVVGLFTIILLSACHSQDKDPIEKDGTVFTDSLRRSRNVSETELNGIGEYSELKIDSILDRSLSAKGKVVYESKCASCHTTDTQTLVGPGWKGTTKLYRASWIMNFITNTDEMLVNNQQAKELMSIYTVKMPQPVLSKEEARSVLEFMRDLDQ